MRLVVLLLVLLATACAGSPPRSPSQLTASDVVEVAAPPPGYELGAKLSVSCSGRRGFRAIENEALADVDCTVERLSRTLRAQAAEARSPYLVDKACRARGSERVRASCTARLAEPTSSVSLSESTRRERGPAPSVDQVAYLDEPRPQDSRDIRVSFAPSAATARRGAHLPARAYDRVAETADLAVGRAALGQLEARCPSCDPAALHHALRVTAGRVGAGEVSEVRCFDDAGDKRCVATALEPWSY